MYMLGKSGMSGCFWRSPYITRIAMSSGKRSLCFKKMSSSSGLNNQIMVKREMSRPWRTGVSFFLRHIEVSENEFGLMSMMLAIKVFINSDEDDLVWDQYYQVIVARLAGRCPCSIGNLALLLSSNWQSCDYTSSDKSPLLHFLQKSLWYYQSSCRQKIELINHFPKKRQSIVSFITLYPQPTPP